MAASAIRTSRLTKDYGGGRGLFGVDLEVGQREVFGLVGASGAGKTTAIRCLMGMIRPTSGTAFVLGIDCLRDSVEVKKKVGYLPGEMPQFGAMRGGEVAAYLARMRGGVDQKRLRHVAERLDLDLGRRFRECSTGDRRKLGLVLAFMHNAELIVLDEPFAHADPNVEREVRGLIRESREAGTTVFLASPSRAAVADVCDRIAELRAGRLVVEVDGDDLALRA